MVTPFINPLAGIVSATGLRKHGGHMTTLSLGQATRLTGRGKTILARAISGRLFAANKEDDGSNIDGAESARVYPFREWAGIGQRASLGKWSRIDALC